MLRQVSDIIITFGRPRIRLLPLILKASELHKCFFLELYAGKFVENVFRMLTVIKGSLFYGHHPWFTPQPRGRPSEAFQIRDGMLVYTLGHC